VRTNQLSAVEARWRSGFQAAKREAEIFQRTRKTHRGRLTYASCGDLFFADMNETAQESAGREHHRTGCDFTAIRKPDPT